MGTAGYARSWQRSDNRTDRRELTRPVELQANSPGGLVSVNLSDPTVAFAVAFVAIVLLGLILTARG